MMVCPVCETEAKDDTQEYCLNCAWEFEYFFDELGDSESKKYKERIKIQQEMYKNISLDKPLKLNLWFLSLSGFLLIIVGFYFLLEYASSTLKISDLERDIQVLEYKPSKQVKMNRSLIEGDLEKGKQLFVRCVGCHGTNGQTKALGEAGIIGGQGVDELVVNLTKYKNGKLNKYGLGMLMKGQISSFSEENIIDISTYISNLTGLEE